MKWNLRWAAARRDIWRPSDLLRAFEETGFTPSLSKVAALWSGKPVSVRLDDLDKMCAALGCTVADLLEAEPLAGAGGEQQQQAAGAGGQAGACRPGAAPRRLPPVPAAELTPGVRNHPVGQCPVCLGWGEMRQSTRCAACAKWCRAFPGQHACLRCDRISHVSRDGLPACLLVIRSDDPGWVFRPVPGRPVQLGFLLPGLRLPRASSLLVPANRKDRLFRETLGDVVPTRQKWRWLARPQPAQPVSPHLVDPAQAVLFDARRSWGCLSAGALGQLPALTPAAGTMVEEFIPARPGPRLGQGITQ